MMEKLPAGLVYKKALPVQLSHVRDIEGYEGPLLSEFRSEHGEPYLYHWCDRDKTHNRWLVVRTVKREILRYEAGDIPLRRLIYECPDRLAFVCDFRGTELDH